MAQHTFPALDTNNTFTGTDNFTGNLQINGTTLGTPTGSGAVVLATAPTIASPTLTGTVAGAGAAAVTVPTVVLTDNSTNAASTAFVKAGSFPVTLVEDFATTTVALPDTSSHQIKLFTASTGQFNTLNKKLIFTIRGQLNSTTSQQLQLNLFVAGVNVGAGNGIAQIPVPATTVQFQFVVSMYVVTTGASGKIRTLVNGYDRTNAAVYMDNSGAAQPDTTVDLTGATTLSLQAACTITGNVSNNCTVTVWEIVQSN